MGESLVLELLRAIRADIAELRMKQREQRGRVAALERASAHLEQETAEMRAEVSGRFDRVLDRFDAIERRLELRDA